MRAMAFLTLLVAHGCAHVQIKQDILGQSATVFEIEQQQVLTNLARFVNDPNTLPAYSVVTSGQAQVNDTGTLQTNPSWTRVQFNSIGATLSGQRVNQQNFAFTPVTDPHRLMWMRTAYRAAIGAPVDAAEFEDACNVARMWNREACGACCPIPAAVSFANCGVPNCDQNWFGYGGRWDVPRGALYVGHHGKTYVWVCSNHTAELANLTASIIGFSVARRQVTMERHPACPSDMCRSETQVETADSRTSELRKTFQVEKDDKPTTLSDKMFGQLMVEGIGTLDAIRGYYRTNTPGTPEASKCFMSEVTTVGDVGGAKAWQGAPAGEKPAPAAASMNLAPTVINLQP